MSDTQKLKVNYIKSNSFRVIHVDGVLGGLTPTGDIFISVYSQRGPIPLVTVQEILESGELGPEITSERVSKQGLVREIEAGLAVDLQVAEQIRDWLSSRIDDLKKLQSPIQQPQGKSKPDADTTKTRKN